MRPVAEVIQPMTSGKQATGRQRRNPLKQATTTHRSWMRLRPEQREVRVAKSRSAPESDRRGSRIEVA